MYHISPAKLNKEINKKMIFIHNQYLNKSYPKVNTVLDQANY